MHYARTSSLVLILALFPAALEAAAQTPYAGAGRQPVLAPPPVPVWPELALLTPPGSTTPPTWTTRAGPAAAAPRGGPPVSGLSLRGPTTAFAAGGVLAPWIDDPQPDLRRAYTPRRRSLTDSWIGLNVRAASCDASAYECRLQDSRTYALAATPALSLGTVSGLFNRVRRAEHGLRSFTDDNRRWIAPALAAGAVVTQGWLHGTFYSVYADKNEVFDTADLHVASYVHASFVWSLTYVAGADPVDALGTSLIADFFFQGFLNLGRGRRFVDRGETRSWDAWGGIYVPKPFTGGARFAQLGVGAALIAGPHLLRRLF